MAITLWHPRRRIGGMCHYMLPVRTNRGKGTPPDGRYGVEALGMMLDALLSAGTRPHEYAAHLYGGADTMPGIERRMPNVGERNIEIGWRFIDKYGFQLLSVDVGDNVPRTVRMNLLTGTVEMRRGTPAS